MIRQVRYNRINCRRQSRYTGKIPGLSERVAEDAYSMDVQIYQYEETDIPLKHPRRPKPICAKHSPSWG